MSTTPLNSAYTFSCTFFNASTGAPRDDLTVNVQLYDETGAAVGSPVSATEFADDRYTYTPAENVLDAYGKWMAEFVPTDTTNVAPVVRRVEVEVVAASAVDLSPVLAAITDIPAAVWAYATASANVVGSIGVFLVDNIAAILAKTNIIGTSGAIATSPTIAAHTIRIVRGDAYSAADGRAIDLVYSGQPDFTSATNVTLKAVRSNRITTTLVTWTGSVLNSTTLRFVPERTETLVGEALTNATQAQYAFEVSLTLASSKVITPTSLAEGKLIVDQQAA